MPKVPESTPQALVSEEGKTSHALRRIRINNRILERTRATGTLLNALIAEVRWLVLRMGRKQHGKAAGIQQNAQLNIERSGLRAQHETFEKLYAFWGKQQQITEGQRERLLRLLVERQYAVRGEPETPPEEPRELSTFDLYRRWGYMKGHKELFKHVKTTDGDEPFTEGGLWQRRAAGVVPEWEELERVHAALRLPEEELRLAQDVWTREKYRQLEERGIPSAYAQLLIAIEASGVRMIPPSLVNHFSITHDLARNLCSGRPVELDDIEQIAKRVMNANEHENWRQRWDDSSEAFAGETPMQAYARVRDARGMTNERIAKAMNLPSPKPSQHLRRTLEEICGSTNAPAGVILGMAAGPDRDPSTGEAYAEQLRGIFLERRRALLRASGSVAGDSDLRLLRDYWGIEPDVLASIARVAREEILLIEQGKRALDARTMKRLLSIVEDLGQDRLNESQKRLFTREKEQAASLDASPESLDQFTETLAKRVGGLNPLQRLYQSPEKHDGVSVVTLKQIGVGRGKLIPPLCVLQRFIDGSGAVRTPALELEWYREYPQFVAKRQANPPKTPLGRAIAVKIAEQWTNPRQFHGEMMQDMISYPTFIRNLQDINKGIAVPWPIVERCVLATGITPEDPFYIYVRCLVDAEGDVTVALRSWRRIAREMELGDFREHERKFGLLPKEAPDVWPAKRKAAEARRVV